MKPVEEEGREVQGEIDSKISDQVVRRGDG
jgi:hypothetical protein